MPNLDVTLRTIGPVFGQTLRVMLESIPPGVQLGFIATCESQRNLDHEADIKSSGKGYFPRKQIKTVIEMGEYFKTSFPILNHEGGICHI